MFDASGLSSHPVDVGIRSEGAILGELSKRGYNVLTPFSYNHRYDLVIDLGDRFVRAQCKTGRLRTGAVVFGKVSTRCSTTAVHRRKYDESIDLFLVYCPDLDAVYAISIDDVLDGVSMLRVEPPANAQRRRINWASDFVLDSGSRAVAALPPPQLPRLVATPE
ncbi:MAG: group I intron-associated PD-(D/E)XK endonuclease [Solirubrobacteraceae bacterium]